MRAAVLILVMSTAIGCTLAASDLDDTSESEAVAQALSKAVSFEGGTVIEGPLPDTTAPDVTIEPLSDTIIMSPGTDSIMSLEVDNPDEPDDPLSATLVRFANTRSHVQVPATRRASGDGPAAGGGGAVASTANRVPVDNAFAVASTVCASLCDKIFATDVTEVAVLQSGAVGATSTRAVVLDCRRSGDPSACAKGSTDDVSADLVDGKGGSVAATGGMGGGSGAAGQPSGGGGTATTGRDAGPAPADPNAIPEELKLCGGVACQCADGVDNDGDGLVDGADFECIGAYDDDEGDFGTALPGDNTDPMFADCFFDGNTGAGDDGCRYALDCGLGVFAPDDPQCVVSQQCLDVCRPLTPNGCDCFGCCTVFHPGGAGDVLVVSGCNAADPTGCASCVKSTGPCENPCGLCELCPGRGVEQLDPSCSGQATCDGSPACEQQADCDPGLYCSYGCCIAVAVP